MIDLPHDLNSQTYAGANDEDAKQIKLNRKAIDFAASMAEQYDMPKAVFDRCGKVTGASTTKGEQHIASYCHHLKNLGEPFDIIECQSMQDMTGTSFYTKGLFTPGAVLIQPAAFILQAAKGLSERVEIYQNSPVIELTAGSPNTVKTAKHTITAEKIILAVNGHIESFGYFKKRLLHVFTYASMTQALTSKQVEALSGRTDWNILPADPMGTTVRRTSNYQGSGDRITVRNHFTLNQDLQINETELAKIARIHKKSFSERFPMLNDVDMQYRWGGRLCLSWNSVPAFGELEKNIYSAACQNGLGTVKGTLSGMLAAEKAVLGETTLVAEYSSYSAPRKLPMEPFLTLGATASLKWKEWLAGKEL
jgi:glycine/D-amino acid oxidase-like deaminating enzyme